jgi:hypothetical protein
MALGSAFSSTCGADAAQCPSGRDPGAGLRRVGLIMLIPGTAAAIVGGAMMLANWRTRIEQGGTEAPASPSIDIWKRSPEARVTPDLAPTSAPALYTPILSGRF